MRAFLNYSLLALLFLPVGGSVLLRRLARRRLAPRPQIVVKLGGSALTQKAFFETLNAERLKLTADQISRRNAHGDLVLVHGAGSFGHFQAKEHGVSRGVRAPTFSW